MTKKNIDFLRRPGIPEYVVKKNQEWLENYYNGEYNDLIRKARTERCVGYLNSVPRVAWYLSGLWDKETFLRYVVRNRRSTIFV